MEYITVREAAEKWKISERLVQKYCGQGRIEGVRKFGVSWGIPENAEKPEDPRREKRRSSGKSGTETQFEKPAARASGDVLRDNFRGLMPLMNTAFEPGTCMEHIRAMRDGERKDIALAEYYYFSGHPESAAREAERYLTGPDQDIRLSACLIYAYANLSLGKIRQAEYALGELRKTLAGDGDATPGMRAAEAFIAATAAVLLHLPLPEELPPLKDFLPALPPGVRAFALYVQAHYLYLQREYDRSLGVVEATFSMGAEAYPIPAVYLHLVAVMDYMSLRRREKAEEHLLAAWDLARPDDLIEGLGEHHGLLGGMLEAVIRPRWPEDFKRIIDITYRFSSGWRKVHNPEAGPEVADDLTTTEFAVAMLASRGWTNQEIGEHMNMSSHTVKRHISSAMQKLGVNRRQDLQRHMLR